MSVMTYVVGVETRRLVHVNLFGLTSVIPLNGIAARRQLGSKVNIS